MSDQKKQPKSGWTAKDFETRKNELMREMESLVGQQGAQVFAVLHNPNDSSFAMITYMGIEPLANAIIKLLDKSPDLLPYVGGYCMMKRDELVSQMENQPIGHA